MTLLSTPAQTFISAEPLDHPPRFRGLHWLMPRPVRHSSQNLTSQATLSGRAKAAATIHTGITHGRSDSPSIREPIYLFAAPLPHPFSSGLHSRAMPAHRSSPNLRRMEQAGG